MEWLFDQLTVYNIASSILGLLGILGSLGIARSKKLLREEVEDIVEEVKASTSPTSPGKEEITQEEWSNIVNEFLLSLEVVAEKRKGRVASILGSIADFLLFWKGRN